MTADAAAAQQQSPPLTMLQSLKPGLWLPPCAAAAAAAAPGPNPAAFPAGQHSAAQTGCAAGNSLPGIVSTHPAAAPCASAAAPFAPAQPGAMPQQAEGTAVAGLHGWSGAGDPRGMNFIEDRLMCTCHV